MRYRAPLLLLTLLLLAACNPLAETPTPAPTTVTYPATLVPVDTLTPVPATATTEPTATTQANPTPTALVGGTPNSESTTVPEANATVEPAIEAQLMEIEKDTAKIRDLTPKAHVPEHFISQDELRKDMVKDIDQDYSPAKGHRDAMSLWLLNLITDPTLDLYQLQIDLLGEQVLGFYDHKKNELFVRTSHNSLSPLERNTLSHEFTHSLQDQYFDLEKVRPDNIDNDRGTGVLALVEGDAVVSSQLYSQQNMTPAELQQMTVEITNSSSKVIDGAPEYIRDSLYFPYEQGPFFIEALAQSQPGSYKAINDALADPPVSTEQVLHPRKYLDTPRDNPKPIEVPPLTSTLGAGWTFSYGDTLGEFDFSEMLKLNGVSDKEASAGWGGARYALYQNGGNALVAVNSVWDTTKDAVEFDTALRQSFRLMKQTGDTWSDGKRTFAAKLLGDHVALVGGTEPAKVKAALAAIK